MNTLYTLTLTELRHILWLQQMGLKETLKMLDTRIPKK